MRTSLPSLTPPLPLKREGFQQAMCAVATKEFNAVWNNLAPDAGLRQDAEKLSAEKYSPAGYNRKR